MPCNSDYMNPTGREKALQQTAKLLNFVYGRLGISSSNKLIEAAKDQYCSKDYVKELCRVISGLDAGDLAVIVYNARDKTSRELANWWEEHQEADKVRKAEELTKTEQKELAKQAINGKRKKKIY